MGLCGRLRSASFEVGALLKTGQLAVEALAVGCLGALTALITLVANTPQKSLAARAKRRCVEVCEHKVVAVDVARLLLALDRRQCLRKSLQHSPVFPIRLIPTALLQHKVKQREEYKDIMVYLERALLSRSIESHRVQEMHHSTLFRHLPLLVAVRQLHKTAL